MSALEGSIGLLRELILKNKTVSLDKDDPGKIKAVAEFLGEDFEVTGQVGEALKLYNKKLKDGGRFPADSLYLEKQVLEEVLGEEESIEGEVEFSR